MEDKKYKVRFIVCIIVIICFLYLGGKTTYTSFESFINGLMQVKTANIALTINGTDVVEGILDNEILLQNLTWTSTYTRSGKISPGSRGTVNLELNPTGSEVAILYEFQFIDKSIDTTKLLNIDNITCDGQLVRTAADTYSGIITLADITNHSTIHLSFDFYFDATVDIEGIREDNHNYEDLFEVNFHAVQYRGETLVPYVEPTPEPEPEPDPEP